MEFDLRLMSVSHSLEKHPVLDECVRYKIKYLNVLEYFVNKYSSKDEFALKALKNYKNRFLGEDTEQYLYSEQELKRVAKGVIGVKFKGFKLFTYRYALVCDFLFINAILDYDKADKILKEIKSIYRKRYHQKLDLIFDILFENESYNEGLDKIKYQVECWKKNNEYLNKKQFTILTTANMSAGKSTLINAMIGKKINRTMNDSCTSKIHYIYDKTFDDGFNYKLDGKLTLDADENTLLQNNGNNNNNRILASTHFEISRDKKYRLCIIDTPGVNSSMDSVHGEITKQSILNEKYDKLLYLVNAENAGTDDDLKYLKFIYDNVDENKIIFVLNKLDKFRESEDSIDKSVQDLKNDLLQIGFTNPVVCPVSSYAGILAKKEISEYEFNRYEQNEYFLLEEKFEGESYNLSRFYPEKIIKNINKNYSVHLKEKHSGVDLLINCGMLCLEEIIIEGAEY